MIENLFDLSEDVAVVTGAGRGIGEGIARTLAAAGAAVVCAARRSAEIESVAESIRKDGGRALSVQTDVTDETQVEHLARSAVDAFGKLDIWVNNAGGSPVQRRLTKLSREDILENLRTRHGEKAEAGFRIWIENFECLRVDGDVVVATYATNPNIFEVNSTCMKFFVSVVIRVRGIDFIIPNN